MGTEPAGRCCRSSSNVSSTPNATSAAELPSVAAAMLELQPEAELVPKLQPQCAIREDDDFCESRDIGADAAAAAHRLFCGEKVPSRVAGGGDGRNGTTGDKWTQEDEGGDGCGRGSLWIWGATPLHK